MFNRYIYFLRRHHFLTYFFLHWYLQRNHHFYSCEVALPFDLSERWKCAQPNLDMRVDFPSWGIWLDVAEPMQPSSAGRAMQWRTTGNRVAELTVGRWQSNVMERAWGSIQVSDRRQTKGCIVASSTNWNQWLIWWQFLTFTPRRIHKRVRIMPEQQADCRPCTITFPHNASVFLLIHTF